MVGQLIATATENPQIPYRPSKDDTNCPAPDAGKWFNSVAGVCKNSLAVLVTFTLHLPNGAHAFAAAEHVVWTVAFNTSTWGYHPIGSAARRVGTRSMSE